MADAELSKSAANVEAALATAGMPGRVVELPGSTRTARDAADTLGCEVAAIANSLVFTADETPLLVMASGAHRVDTEFLASQLNCGRIRRASPEQVREATGQVIGGVAPVGHPRRLRTVVDASLEAFPRIWAAAGTPHAVFPLTFAELVELTGGVVLPVVSTQI